MYKVVFYKDKNGKEQIADYILELSKKNDKDSRIKLSKIREYITVLSMYGTQAGEPYIKHLMGDIWELRPLKNRILFAAWIDNKFVLLHYFQKQTKKTPMKEIIKAVNEFNVYKRENKNE